MQQLSIELVDGTPLDLAEGAQVSLDWVSPVLAENLWGGAYSFPFSLPWTAHNQHHLGYLNARLTRANRRRTIPVTLVCDAYRLKATLETTYNTREALDCNLVSPDGGVPDKLRNTLLTDLPLGADTIPTTPFTGLYWIAQDCYSNPEGGTPKIEFWLRRNGTVIANISYLAGVGNMRTSEGFTRFATDLNTNPAYQVYARASGTSLVISPINEQVATFNLEVRNNLPFIPGGLGNPGFTPYQGDMLRMTYQTLAPWPNALATADNSRYVLAKVHNPDFYGPSDGEQANGQWNGYENQYAGGYFHNNPLQSFRYNLVPMPYLAFAVRQVMGALGYTVSGSFLEHPHVQRLIIHNLRALDRQAPEYTYPFNTYDPVVRYAYLLPPITVADFLLALRNVFCLAYYFDRSRGRVIIRLMEEVLQQPCRTDWTDKASPDYREDFEFGGPLGLEWALESDDQSQSASDKVKLPALFAPYVPVADPLEETETLTVSGASLISETIAGQRTPFLRQPGVSPFYGRQNGTFGLRLLFWLGVTSVSNPEAHHTLTLNGLTWTLQWNGPNGLVERLWKRYLAFRSQTYATEMPVNLDALDLATLDLLAKYHVEGATYLVRRVQVSLPMRQPPTLTLARW